MNPLRLHVIAEGQTEMTFAQRLLGPHLRAFGVETFSRCVLTGRDKRSGRSFRGGMTTYAKAKNDIVQLDWEYLEHEGSIRALSEMVQATGGNPEKINNGAETAPSKRIADQIKEYDKVTGGNAVVEKIGLAVLRQKCRHFGEWLTRLEKLP